MRKILQIVSFLLLLAGLTAVGFYIYQRTTAPAAAPLFRTEKILRRNLMSTISASGTVEPEELVNVGAQVNGKIMSFGTDIAGQVVDYGSKVKAGTLLARIDEVTYEAEVRDRTAAKQQAEAAILSAQAEIKAARARSVLAKRNYKRASKLQPQAAIARSDYDEAEAELLAAEANIAVAEAQLAKGEAQLAAALAGLTKAQRNLSYCTITSPVDGVIIDRRVSIGQTVVSNMSASNIFLIAKDLKKMQVWVSVNEADIGEIHPGMPVVFTVDAFPGQQFFGKVHKIRLNATMSQNVVTFVVEVATDNSSGKLLPYLTANVRFIKAQRQNVLTVSNAALRFVPPRQLVAPEFQADYDKLLALRQNSPGGEKVLWHLNAQKQLVPLKVKTGLANGIFTEISLPPSSSTGDHFEAVNGLITHTQISGQSAGNPFVPKFGGKRSGKKLGHRR